MDAEPNDDKPSSRLRAKIAELVTCSALTQSELARRIGMQQSHLNPYLRGRADIRSERFVHILRELGIDLEVEIENRIRQLSRDPKRAQESVATETTHAQ